ncbi:all-trans retinoic acid-induced differentiation factor isoform X1 [Python bivittatus]|uniref:All-trans retinoic acid-induced differentiation factor isoform X1 n=1 Tax=Python bivittatus TaxID=176946 RepID=A0A9F5MYA3_PYTBI|nr:all-trans retinoic acid-induced differentiation factor isoform X1 [Python bivittatus]
MAAPSWLWVPQLFLCLMVPSAAALQVEASEQVCGCCAGPMRNESVAAVFCGSRWDRVRRGRCCLEGDQKIVLGLDFGNCSLHRLCSSFQEVSTAFVIDLTDNPLESLPEGSFQGFTQLQTLALPLKLDCPGGSEVWKNITIQGNNRLCQDQRNPCNGSGGFDSLCPEGSLCTSDGPGLSQCLCVDPYHGYKCLRQILVGWEHGQAQSPPLNKGQVTQSALRHHKVVAERSFACVHFVQQLCPFMDWKAQLTVNQALVTSCLDYCNILYLGLTLKTNQKLQLVQNGVAEAIAN